MLFYVLDHSYKTIDVLDTFVEAIWTDRFRETGDFEIHLPISYCRNRNLAKGNYLYIKDSDRYMIIEDSVTETKTNSGDPVYKLVGRGLESILERRIVWNQIDYSGTVHDLIKRILNENIISPSNSARAIPNFTFIDSSGGKMGETITIQLHGENVLDVIEDLCATYDLGFKVLPVGEGGFSFQLYTGVNRSYSQNVNPWVVFSPKYENISDTQLTEKESVYKNTALVYNQYQKTDTGTYTDPETGETQTWTNTYTVTVSEEVYNKLGAVSGLDRKELYYDSSASHEKANGIEYTPSEYREVLINQAKKELETHFLSSVFLGTIEPYRQFVLGRDFNLGDIVSIENEYGQKGRCRVVEVIHSHSTNGETILPTFENVEDNKILT